MKQKQYTKTSKMYTSTHEELNPVTEQPQVNKSKLNTVRETQVKENKLNPVQDPPKGDRKLRKTSNQAQMSGATQH